MSEYVAVLFANEAFYLAFAGRDLEAMDHVWAARTPVTCIHPGWNLLCGRNEVMASWRAILGAAETVAIRCRDPSANVLGDTAYVTCYESLDRGLLIATNIFAREDGAWKMVHHQAGAAPQPQGNEDEHDARPPGDVIQ